MTHAQPSTSRTVSRADLVAEVTALLGGGWRLALVAAHEDADTFRIVYAFLRPVGQRTELTVVETGFETTSDPAANLADHRDGWNGELDKLVALLESDS